MLIETLFVNAPTLEATKVSFLGEWTHKLWFIHRDGILFNNKNDPLGHKDMDRHEMSISSFYKCIHF